MTTPSSAEAAWSEPAKAAAQSTHDGRTYYFCAVGCKQKFDREPDKYLAR